MEPAEACVSLIDAADDLAAHLPSPDMLKRQRRHAGPVHSPITVKNLHIPNVGRSHATLPGVLDGSDWLLPRERLLWLARSAATHCTTCPRHTKPHANRRTQHRENTSNLTHNCSLSLQRALHSRHPTKTRTCLQGGCKQHPLGQAVRTSYSSTSAQSCHSQASHAQSSAACAAPSSTVPPTPQGSYHSQPPFCSNTAYLPARLFQVHR
jgi:hypothetical protein